MLAAVVLVSSAQAQPKPDFAQDVRPILESRCWTCHGSKLQLHGLRLDHRADALKGGGSGVPAIVPGASAQSLLIKYVAGLDKDVVMPPTGPRLKLAEVAVLRAWIAAAAYGERWGRHWLDLVRYAESNGYERDGTKPQAWRYRDYVIQAFNQDKPFDRFILEQLAGDELPDASADTFIATGYYRLGPWDDEPADSKEDRFDQLDDMVSTTSQTFLGLTLGCARCHNHKFEPLTARDYYTRA